MSRKIIYVVIIVIMVLSSFFTGYYVGYKIGSVGILRVLRIGYLMADLHHTPFLVAFSKGFYEEEGITCKRLEYVNGPAQIIAFSAGELDAGYVGIVPALIAKAKGIDLVIVASVNLEGSALVSSHELKTVSELNGKVVGTPGIGTIQDCLLCIIEKKFNITVIHKQYKVSDLPIALAKREVNAYIAWEPFPTEAVVEGIGHVMCTSHDILPNHQCCVFYVSGKIYREQPDLLKKLVNVHIKAIRYIVSNRTDAMKIFSEMTGKPLEIIEGSWDRIIWDYRPNIESIRAFINYLIEQGKIKAEDILDVNKFLNELIPADLQDLLAKM